jgi:hypothetical protein
MGTEDVVVGISDRMLTVRDETEYESETTKIYLFGRIACLSAGDADVSLEIARATHLRVDATGASEAGEVANLFARSHARLRRRRLEQTWLAPLGLSLTTFVSRQHELDADLVSKLANRMLDEEGDLGTQSILVGVDSTGPHIYQVIDPGTSRCRDKPGFFAIGMGATHFETVFMSECYGPQWPLEHTLLLMYSAKRQAEMAPGVGRATDMFIMHKGGWHGLAPQELQVIDTHYIDLLRRNHQVRAEIVQSLAKDFMTAGNQPQGLFAPPATPQQSEDQPSKEPTGDSVD